jgi:hypothetical protein
MRAHTIISIIVLGALAIPASASADPLSSDYSRADAIAAGLEESSQSTSGSDYNGQALIASPNASTPPVSEPGTGYSSLNATTGPSPDQPTFVSDAPSAGDQFDWGDAALGAGAALALTAFGGAALLTVRRRTAISPSASTS